MSFKMLAWFIGMWIVGGFIFTLFGVQISIMTQCAMKLYSMVRNDTEYWYSNACHRYMKKVIRNNRIIIAVIFILALLFVPLIGTVGFCAGYFLKWLFTRGATGINDQNLEECIAIFLRFAKPGMEETFGESLRWAAHKLKNDSIFMHI